MQVSMLTKLVSKFPENSRIVGEAWSQIVAKGAVSFSGSWTNECAKKNLEL